MNEETTPSNDETASQGNAEGNLTPPPNSNIGKAGRAALNAAGGAIPLFGGLLAAAAGAWGEREQQRVNDFLASYMRMLHDEMKEKHETIEDTLRRLNLQDEKTAKRLESPEYQALVRKTFRDWAGAESARKREYIRNVLSNAASTDIASDDVVRLFLDWLARYSEFHFAVVAVIYKNPAISRGQIWEALGKEEVREDSSDADLFRLLIDDLSQGRIIRQRRDTDHQGNFLKSAPRRTPKGHASRTLVSAFDDDKLYVLTELGQQFVHYAMTDIPIKVAYAPQEDNGKAA